MATARRARLLPALTAWLSPWQRATGPVIAPRINERALSAAHHLALRRCCTALGWTGWQRNALRHSFGSHRLAVLNDIARTALEMGNSPGQIRAHYNDSKDPEEAAAYFAVMPTTAANIIQLSA